MQRRRQQQPKEQAVTTHEISTAQPSGLAELKQAHRRIWASGSYASVAERIVDDVPPRHLLERVRIEPGMEVLDLATGTGNVAIRAAQLGARVTGVDLTPELFGRARERAAAAGVEVEWVAGDAEDLPFEDERFDVVLSTFGIQFAPRHDVAAREAVRVTRAGGTIGLINWTPQGHIGRVLKAVGARMPRPPAYASPPPSWGDEAHVRALLEPEGVELTTEGATNPFVGFTSPEDFVRFMETNYGPLLKAREKLAPEGAWDELREEVVALTASFDRGRPGALHVESEYLLIVGEVVAA
jgi:SAM-dependent methyltransferase